MIIKIKINVSWFYGLLKKNYYLQLKELVVKKDLFIQEIL